ncbi:MAG: hypothetical protein O2857_16340 [Planctomycetota bacterium]|nr:hypothetical protein [Planctomycetota bacterium]
MPEETTTSLIDPEATSIPLRGIAIGALLAFLLNVFDVYATLIVMGSYMTLNFSTPAALFFFFFVILISGVVAAIRKPLALNKAELVTIYIMLMVACCVPSMGFIPVMLPQLVGPTYYATFENQWANLYNKHVPHWIAPADEETARYFFERLPPGVPFPWWAWVLPLTYWYGFFMVLSLAMTCAMILLRKQWVERERLAYPLVQVPLDLIRHEESGFIGRSFFSNRLMWLGFAFSFILLSVNGIHFYFPEFPKITKATSISFFEGSIKISFWFSPSWIGFFYFVGLDISASIWFFYLLSLVQQGVFTSLALRSTERLDLFASEAYTAHQGMGSMIVFVLITLWLARSHLADVFRKAFPGDSSVDDSDEVLSYRQAVIGLIAGMGLLGLALRAAGLPFLGVAMLLFSAFVIFISLTGVVAKGGIPAMRPPLMSSSFVISGAGTGVLGPQGLTALGLTYGWHSEIRSFVMASVANGLKMCEIIEGSKRRLFGAIMLAVLASLIGSTLMLFHLAYTHGGANLNPLFFGRKVGYGPIDMVRRMMEAPTGPRLDAYLFMAIGGTVMGLLVWARNCFPWWPFSPLGYMISANWKTGHIFISALAAWFIKLLVLKYGGASVYRKSRMLFMGLILGEVVGAGVWLCIDFITGHTGSFLTQI